MLNDRRILVVEDDPHVAEIIQWNLYAAGYAATVVADGMAALQAFDEIHPCLVTLDLNVPAVSGFRLVELFKRHAPEVPVVIVTALSFEEAEEIARAGADDFVTKPFEPYDLLQKVHYHLSPPRRAAQLVAAPPLPARPRRAATADMA